MLKLFRVDGISMWPVLACGDFVLATRWYRRLTAGELVVVRHPRYGCVVKRITDIDSSGQLRLCGENADSVSTQAMGWLPGEAVVAKVLCRISCKFPPVSKAR